MAQALRGLIAALLMGLCAVAFAAGKGDPAWNQLTPEQRKILAPLAEEWENLEPQRKQKWLGIAARYPKMAPEEQARIQRRMQPWAALSSEQRRAARENFQGYYSRLPAAEKRAVRQKWEEYQRSRESEQRTPVGPEAAPAPQASPGR